MKAEKVRQLAYSSLSLMVWPVSEDKRNSFRVDERKISKQGTSISNWTPFAVELILIYKRGQAIQKTPFQLNPFPSEHPDHKQPAVDPLILPTAALLTGSYLCNGVVVVGHGEVHTHSHTLTVTEPYTRARTDRWPDTGCGEGCQPCGEKSPRHPPPPPTPHVPS